MKLIIELIVIVVAAFFLYVLFVLMPVSIYAEAKCLEEGYPKASVTFTLKQYCIGIDGVVKDRVKKL